jgi:hypothetical protein
VGTVNVGSRAPADPSFIWRCARGGHCHEWQAPPIRARLGSGNRSGDLVLIRRSGGEITSLTPQYSSDPNIYIG